MSWRPPSIIDVDVHPSSMPLPARARYLDGKFLDLLGEFFEGGPPQGVVLPRSGYRLDAIPPSGGPQGSDPAFVLEQYFEPHGIDYGVLGPTLALSVGQYPDPDLAAALCRATNDWIADEWLPVDPRFLGSILVCGSDPQQAVDEIRRLHSNPQMVQVLLGSPAPCLLGDRFLFPIYRACDELGLPVAHHVSSRESLTELGHYSAGGVASTYCEFHVSMAIPAVRHLPSLVFEGVFAEFPRIRILLQEFGTAWLPFVVWRMDMEYRANREDVPWVTSLPSTYVREHVRVSTQPLEEPPDSKDLATLLSLVGGEELLVFASDYPHHDYDDPALIRRRLPEAWHDRVFATNAAALYGLEQVSEHPVSVG